MSAIALVHGAFLGGWCWDLLRPELLARGHQVIAVDLPCEDPAAGPTRYAEIVVEATRDAGDDLLVVGHSLGGLTIPLVAAARPVRRLVFLAAFIPWPGEAFSAHLGDAGMFPPSQESSWPLSDDDGLMRWPAERMIPALMPDAPPEVAAWAASRARRQSRAPHQEVCPLDTWPDVPSSYILCREDSQVGAEWARQAARERLDTTAIELPGSHMPMLARPAELAAALAACASL
jgi:pimeloyl-ACP methyl ester carboxylesterase